MTGVSVRRSSATAVLLTIVALAACEVSIDFIVTNRVAGTVVDARQPGSVGIGSVALTLKDSAGATAATVTSATDGTFQFTEINPGTYTISGALANYAFIDKQVAVAGNDKNIEVGTILGFSNGETDISIIAVWSSGFLDVDSHLSYPLGNRYVADNNPSLTGLDPYTGRENLDIAGDVLVGFFPEGTFGDPERTGANRERVYYPTAYKASSSLRTDFYGGTDTRPSVKLDRDDTDGAGPETITIIAPPMTATAVDLLYSTAGSATNGLSAGNYAWIGVMEYYVDAYDSPSSSESATPNLSTENVSGGAQVEVYVVQGTTVKGRFVVPDYINIDKASILRVNLFVYDDGDLGAPVYQFLPDLRLAGSVRGVANAPLVLYGEPRR